MIMIMIAVMMLRVPKEASRRRGFSVLISEDRIKSWVFEGHLLYSEVEATTGGTLRFHRLTFDRGSFIPCSFHSASKYPYRNPPAHHAVRVAAAALARRRRLAELRRTHKADGEPA